MTFIARIAFVPLLFAAASHAEEKTTALPRISPFGAPGVPAVAADAATERIEFAGVSAVGKKTDLIFYDKVAKKSHWIGLGETKEGIAVVTYDERREQAIVKINGVEKILPLRKGQRTAGAPRAVTPLPAGFNVSTAGPSPLPIPTATSPTVVNATAPTPSPEPIQSQPSSTPPAPSTPESQQQRQETEARMLVSDLLEIGMAQRKAYEEAQRKAAEGNPQNPSGPEAPRVVPSQPNPPAK
jgi:hypothetical protein